jgi:hypothetical protein
VLDLTTDEARLVASLLTAKGARVRPLQELLSEWDEFVNKVERGYRLTIYDYTNDLGTRNLLQYLSRTVSSELSHRIETALKNADDRFTLATVEFPRGVVPRPADPDRWWYFRKPKIVDGELKEDFLELESPEADLQ